MAWSVRAGERRLQQDPAVLNLRQVGLNIFLTFESHGARSDLSLFIFHSCNTTVPDQCIFCLLPATQATDPDLKGMCVPSAQAPK